MKKQTQKNVKSVLENAKKIAFYGRVSTERQNIENTHQVEAVKQYLKQYGKTLDGEPFRDTISAYSKSFNEREGLRDLLQAIKTEKFDAVVVSDRDRLSRQTDEHFSLRDLFEKIGIPVVIASRNELYDTNNFMRNLIEDALTKLESDNISVRTKASMKALLENESYIGGQPPYGYEPIKVASDRKGEDNPKVKGFVIKEDEMKNVREIFERYKKSDTFSSIAKYLKEMSGDKKWTATKVKGIILNPIYTGYLFYNRYDYVNGKRVFKPVENWISYPNPLELEAIISLEEWWFCWQKYERLQGRAPRYLDTSFYFNNLIRCYCGSDKTLTGKDQRTNKHGKGGMYGYRYYVCSCCKAKILADELHEQFFELLFHMPHPSDYILDALKQMFRKEMSQREDEYGQLKKNLKNDEKTLSLLHSYAVDHKSKDILLHESDNHELLAYHIIKNDTEEKIKKCKFNLQRVKGELQRLREIETQENFLEDIVNEFFDKGNWVCLSNLERRNMVLFLVEKCSLITKQELSITIRSLSPLHLQVRNYVK